MRSLEILRPDGGRLACLAEGSGPLVVLIASTGRGAEDFAPLAQALAGAGYRVLAPQPRGLNGSDGPVEDVSFDDFAADVAALIEAGGGPAVVAGHAYGNWIARAVAEAHPGLVRGTVLLAAAATSWPAALSAALDSLLDPATPDAARDAALRLAFVAPGNSLPDWRYGWYGDVARMQRRARRNTVHGRWQEAGQAPVLDLIAAQDPFRPPQSHDEYRRLLGPRTTCRVLDGASHALPCERPGETAAALHDWISRLPDRAAGG